MKKFIKRLVILIAVLIAALYVTDTNYLIKAVRTIYAKGYTTAYLEDYKEFDNVIVENGTPQPWPIHDRYNSVKETESLVDYNISTGTVAYVIIKNDSVWFENYYDGFDKDSKTNSFSMAKSYVSGLLGKAISDGYVKSLEQPVGEFFPEFS